MFFDGLSIEAFWSRVAKPEPYACWDWLGGKTTALYPLFIRRPAGIRMYAHRAAYMIAVGAIPKGYEIDHLCKNTMCVNPIHLEAVTQRENWLRSDNPYRLNLKKTHCPQGHPLAGDNLLKRKRGGRECKTCTSNRSREWYRRTRRVV